MQLEEIKQLDKKYISQSYGRSDVLLEEGKGCCVSGGGKSYLDMSSGIGVNCLGFCGEKWADAVSAQAHKLQHTSNLFYTQPCVLLAQKLCERTGMNKAFFGNSGAEANEGAIKAARKYSFDKYNRTDRYNIISLQNSFHGRTIATLSATGQDVFHKNFFPFVEGFKFVEAGDFEALKNAADDTVCAVIMELIQGEGGVIAQNQQYVDSVVKLCAEKDILLIIDEVQTGVGRTGKFLCCEHYGITPDIVTLAKGVGGGLPIGVVLLGDKVQNTFTPGDHASTFGGNPVVCAGANVVMDTLTDGFLSGVKAKSDKLRAGLMKLPHVTGVSGLGLMVGVEFDDKIAAKQVLAAAADKGLICLTAKTKLRLLPPLVITDEEIDKALSILKSVLEVM
ncbi:MAG: aspartate aminotransferase family protein [Clostridia bacterium]|nr:aspartate aminotransferase family protein [Clostridia bacterium]NLS84525.1 aspartate aminotransferase family protein [Oscillospiraceae bacterium]